MPEERQAAPIETVKAAGEIIRHVTDGIRFTAHMAETVLWWSSRGFESALLHLEADDGGEEP